MRTCDVPRVGGHASLRVENARPRGGKLVAVLAVQIGFGGSTDTVLEEEIVKIGAHNAPQAVLGSQPGERHGRKYRYCESCYSPNHSTRKPCRYALALSIPFERGKIDQ